jgi:hypothetical protein
MRSPLQELTRWAQLRSKGVDCYEFASFFCTPYIAQRATSDGQWRTSSQTAQKAKRNKLAFRLSEPTTNVECKEEEI